MSATAGGVEQAAIQQYCKALRTPTIGTQFAAMAEQAQREEHTYTRYLEALLAMEVEERERNTVARRIQAARFPRMKTLEDFDFSRSKVPANRIRGLADGGYLEHAEPVVLIGECGTGKTHLATGLCVAACRQKKRVRFTTAAGLINELGRGPTQQPVPPGSGPMVPIRVDCHRRSRLRPDGRPRRRTPLSGHLGSSRASDGDLDNESAVLGMDPGVSQCSAVQGVAGPDNRSRTHHRDRNRILPVSAHVGETTETTASSWKGETRERNHVLRVGSPRGRRAWAILETEFFPERKKKNQKERNGGLWKMKRCGNPKNQDSHSAWKSLAKGARLSHISNTGPTVIITTRNY